MNRTDLIAKAAADSGLSQADMTRALKALNATIQTAVAAGEPVDTGLGKYERAHRKATTARNPSTGETIPVAAKDVPVFRPNGAFKAAVNA